MCPTAVERFPLFVLYYAWFYLFLIALGLHYCTQAFSSSRAGGRWLLFVAVHRIIAEASLAVEHGLWGTGASVVMMHGFSCPAEYGIFPDQRWNPCPLHCTLNHWITREVLSLIFNTYCQFPNPKLLKGICAFLGYKSWPDHRIITMWRWDGVFMWNAS